MWGLWDFKSLLIIRKAGTFNPSIFPETLDFIRAHQPQQWSVPVKMCKFFHRIIALEYLNSKKKIQTAPCIIWLINISSVNKESLMLLEVEWIQELCWRMTAKIDWITQKQTCQVPHIQDCFLFQVLFHSSTEPKMMGCLDPPFKPFKYSSVMLCCYMTKYPCCGRAAWFNPFTTQCFSVQLEYGETLYSFFPLTTSILHYTSFCELEFSKQFYSHLIFIWSAVQYSRLLLFGLVCKCF